MVTARLRKRFAYPDSDNDSEPEGLDEEEQEQLISTLLKVDAAKTENYKKGFLFLPFSIILYILFVTTTTTALTHLLAVTSLLSSAYALWIQPSSLHASNPSATQRATFASASSQDTSPLKRYIDYLNAGLCVILALAAIRAKQRHSMDDVWLNLLPSLVFLMLYLARTQLRPVDVRELEKLKYGYKGA